MNCQIAFTDKSGIIGVMLTAMMLVSMAFVPAVSGHVEKNSNTISEENSISYTTAELEEDTAWRRSNANDMIIGWTHDMDHNGKAERCDISDDGPFAVCADTADGVDWPHDSIVQHEVSHNFDAADQNSPLHSTCIMNYAYAYAGTNVWCSSCGNTVHNGIDN